MAKDDEERRALIARNVALEESVKALKETKVRPTASFPPLFFFQEQARPKYFLR